MKNATMARKLRFSDAVYAINTTPKALRNWLQRGLVDIYTPQREDGGWAEYSFIDIAILALVRQLVNFGVNVPTASGIANKVMTEFFPSVLNVKEPDNMPAGVLAAMWVNRRLYVYPNEDGDSWHMRCVALWESDLSRKAEFGKAFPERAEPWMEHFNPDAPSGIALIRREIEPAPAFLSIDVESVFTAAFERAAESANEGADD